MDWNATSPSDGLGILIEHADRDVRGFNIRCNAPIVDMNVSIPVNFPVIPVAYPGHYVVTRGTESIHVDVPGPVAPPVESEPVTYSVDDEEAPKPKRKKKVSE